VPYLDLAASALAPGVSPVRVYYRDAGAGPPIVILHGGWGYDIYPFERQIGALAPGYRVIAADRTGYGRSTRLERQATDFHRRAAGETFAMIEALQLDRPIVWGHSDGAVIALLMGLSDPDRLCGLVVEAAHFWRSKPGSREFFETMMRDPDGLGERVAGVLAREHGDGWRDLIRTNGDAWLRIAGDPLAPAPDLYGGRLGELSLPTLVIHGALDPRTEPGEFDAMRDALRPGIGPASFEILAAGGHSPHSERATADEVTRLVESFVKRCDSSDRPDPRDRSDLPALSGSGGES
jgi:pimeloyl-ACP methyl ester carboxylesterase